MAVAHLLALLALQAAAPDPPQAGALGDWLTPDGEATVRIQPCPAAPARLCGVVTALKPQADAPAPTLDRHNPDRRLRDRPVVGLTVLADFELRRGVWRGRAYDPDNGLSYSAQIEVRHDAELMVKGCILLACRTEVWTRPAPATFRAPRAGAR